MTFLDIEPTATGSGHRHRWPMIAAAAAVMAIVAGGLVFAARNDGGTELQVPAHQPTALGPLTVAESFMDAWVAGDGDAVAALFGPDDHVIGPYGDMVIGPFGGSPGWPNGIQGAANAPALHDWYRAAGFEFQDQGCQLTASRIGTSPAGGAFCSFTYETDLTRYFDRAPVSGNFWLEINDETVRYAQDQQMFNADADISYVFKEWVSNNHPDDVERMYSAPDSFVPRIDRSSIALWQRYLDEFTASPATVSLLAAEPRTMAEYGARVRATCAAASVRLDRDRAALPQSGGAQSEANARIGSEALAELRALRPPEDRDEIEMVFSQMEQQIALEAQAAAAASAGDVARAESLIAERVDLTHRQGGGVDFQYCPVSLGA